MTRRKSATKAKRSLTPAQRLAIERRKAERELRKCLASIEEWLRGPSIPENQRAKTARALAVILHGGHLFTLACGKAYIARTWRQWGDPTEFWRFVDEQNALFERTMIDRFNDPAMVESWNAPDYELPADAEKKAS